MSLQPLDKKLRRQLENTIVKARNVAEAAAKTALERLCVGDSKPGEHLTEDMRQQRNKLRAHGRQLGDSRQDNAEQSIEHLVQETAYEQWHRMLFARFLAENGLLIYEDGVTQLSIQDCFELAQDESGVDGWELAGRYASAMLPQLFRPENPVLTIRFSPEHQRELEKLLEGLEPETFQASDSLGWVYQYWQTQKKDEVNKSGNKIGADELSAVTQLFTEPYMVSFLLDNSLGAWWVSNYPQYKDLLPFQYLRYAPEQSDQENDEYKETEIPAAGTFEQWPKNLSELKMLDPCCGSGHFLVATLLMLVPMRMKAEGLSADEAIARVLSENIHGLELDQRCVEIAAFAVALEAWRYPESGGYRPLPSLNIAWVGQSIKAKKEDWLSLAGDDECLYYGMEALYNTFKDAPLLGSLIDPGKSIAKDLLSDGFADLQPLLNQALQQFEVAENQEAVIAAKGLTLAVDLLNQKYELIATNVPYLSSGKMCEGLKNYCERYYPYSKGDLANVFQERCFELNVEGGVSQMVMPQLWLQLKGFENLRKKILTKKSILDIAILGVGAFDEISGEVVNVILFSASNTPPLLEKCYFSFDVSQAGRGTVLKSVSLLEDKAVWINQLEFIDVDESRILSIVEKRTHRFGDFFDITQGIGRGDLERFDRFFWELAIIEQGLWLYMISSPKEQGLFEARSKIFYWENGKGALVEHESARVQGLHSWNVMGVVLSRSQELRVTMSSGYPHAENCVAITPKKSSNFSLSQLWQFTQSSDFKNSIKRLSSKVIFPTGIIKDIPLKEDDLLEIDKHTTRELTEQYTDNLLHWIFHGHPDQAEEPLQVAVARLLGYQWPAESDKDMELSDQARAWLAQCESLASFVDDDGIVCLSPVRGEKAADERLEALLMAAFGEKWNASLRNKLLSEVNCKGKSLDFWLREKFFEQHCKLFQNRPFIWHIWDGLADGFNALVNYHQLDRQNLERLIYTYLGDWIRTQDHGVKEGVDGAILRLQAAQILKKHLEAILEGEAPYDIFVRWKSLAEQPLGWNPDINDGVRLNIRPFMSVPAVGKKEAGILRSKPNIKWTKDRGNDVASAPWYTLGLQYGESAGSRINDHHLKLAEKKDSRL